MSIKVRVGQTKNVRIVAAGEKRPVIVPDSIALGVDTVGNYISRIDGGAGIIVFPENDVESANIVISHANTTTEISSNNDVLTFPRNIDIDQFGHITGFYNTSFNPLNFFANSSTISTTDITFGDTVLTLGESTNEITGLETVSSNNAIVKTLDVTKVINSANTFVDFSDLILSNVLEPVAPRDVVNKAWLDFELDRIERTIKVFDDPVLPTDATNKRYVDNLVQGLRVRPSALAATTEDLNATFEAGNTTFASTLTISPREFLYIDDVTSWDIGDNLLVKDQTDPRQNGSYDLIQKGDANTEWVFQRSYWSNESEEVPGSYEFVTDGTENRGTGWVVTVADASTFTINTDAVNWIQFQGEGTYTGGDGIDLTGTTFSVNVDGSTIEINNDILRIKDAGITNTKLENSSVTFGTTQVALGANTDIIEGLTRVNVGQINDLGTIVTDYLIVQGDGGITIPVGTTAERPTGVQGTIRYNSSDNQFEGYNGTAWSGLGGVIDVDQDTKITAENSSGADNDQLKFFTGGNLIATFSIANSEFTNDFILSGNTVSITSEFISDLVPYTTGAYNLGSGSKNWGSLFVDNIRNSNQVINIDATGAVNIPKGTTLQRPSPSVAGAFRYNLTDNLFEGFDGINWFSIGGVIDGNQDTKITAEDSPGANNDELKFFTNGVQRFIIENDSIVSNVDIIVDTTGAITIPVGTSVQRPPAGTGMIRFNLTDNQFEGYNGLVWTGLGGVIDADQDTKITAESVSAADEDELKFFTRGTLAAKFDSANNAFFYGDVDVAGNVTIGGNIRIGDQDVDTVTVVADFTSDLIPDSNRVYSLGSETKNWFKLYADTIRSSNEVVTVDTTGALKLPASSTSNRPTPVTGMVRFNTTDGQFEGYDGIAWAGLGGVIDVNQDTKITAEDSPGANNDELKFFTNGGLAAKIVANNDAYFYGNVDVAGNVTIGGNITIGDQTTDTVTVVADFTSNIIPDVDRTYNLGAAGKNWNKIFVDTIDSDDEIVVFDTTGAIKLPSANTSLRPTPEVGMLRFNTEDQRFEGYDGTQWAGLAGSVIDVDRNTYIIAETSPGANNNDLDFWTDGVHRMQIDQDGNLRYGNNNLTDLIIYYNTGEIVVNGKVSSEDILYIDSNNYISASNNVIGDVADPVNQGDVVTLRYLENSFSSKLNIVDNANTYPTEIDLLQGPTIELGDGLELEAISSANNSFKIGLDKPGNITPGIYGNDRFMPRIRINAEGRIDFVTEIPVELQANAIPDFTETSRDIIGLMFTDGQANGMNEGISFYHDDPNDQLFAIVDNFNIILNGDISGTAEVTRLSNTTITTSIDVDYVSSIETSANSGILVSYTPGPAANVSIELDFNEIDNFYLPLTGGTLFGNIAAPRFVDSNNTNYFADPAGTSRFNGLHVGYNFTFSQITMSDGPGSASYIYASGGKIGFLDNTFNYAAYSERSTGDWVVQNGDVKAERFVDADAPTYLLHPGGTGTYLHSVQVQNTLQGGNISINTNTISSTTGNITLNSATGLIDVTSDRITNLADPVDAQDAATKAYVDATAQGLRVIPSALAATTGNLVGTYDNINGTLALLATPTLNIDGVTSWSVGDRLLVKDQTNAEENGSYELTVVGDALTPWVFTRGQYFNESSEIPGAFQFVTDGTQNNGTGWVATVTDAETFVIGTDDVTWYQFSGAGTYTAGVGLTLTGTEFSITNPQITISGEAGANTDISLGGTLVIEGTDGVNTTVSAGKISIAVDELDGGTF